MKNSMLNEVHVKQKQQDDIIKQDDVSNEDVIEDEVVLEPDTAMSQRRLPDVEDIIEEADTDVTVEMQPGGAETVRSMDETKQVDMELPPKRKGRPVSSAEMVYVRNIPRSLINEAKQMFPGAKNVTDAVTAFMAFYSGVTTDLTEEQTALVAAHTKEDSMASTADNVAKMRDDMKSMSNVIQELEFCMSYMLFDRLGYRKESSDTPEKVNMVEHGVDGMLNRIRECYRMYHEREKVRKGRPIR